MFLPCLNKVYDDDEVYDDDMTVSCEGGGGGGLLEIDKKDL